MMFLGLYRRYWRAKKWLDEQQAAGTATSKDIEDYAAEFLVPLDSMWKKANEAERQAMEAMMAMVEGTGK